MLLEGVIALLLVARRDEHDEVVSLGAGGAAQRLDERRAAVVTHLVTDTQHQRTIIQPHTSIEPTTASKKSHKVRPGRRYGAAYRSGLRLMRKPIWGQTLLRCCSRESTSRESFIVWMIHHVFISMQSLIEKPRMLMAQSALSFRYDS